MISEAEVTNFSEDVEATFQSPGATTEKPPWDSAANGGGGGESVNHDDVCRDFMKNICNRGTRCKFFHPPKEVERQQREEINFCLDYQNKGCKRDACRYVHAFRDDAEQFRTTGQVSTSLARAIAAVSHKDNINGIPFCKEYQAGKCERAARCRYWHIIPEEERALRQGGGRGGRFSGSRTDPRYNRPTDFIPPPGGYGDTDADYVDGPEAKRGRFPGPSPVADRYVIDLERRNAELEHENDSLKRELKRERERYDDLYYLFRRDGDRQSGAPLVGQVSVAGALMPTSVPAPVQAPMAQVGQMMVSAGQQMQAVSSVGMGMPNDSIPTPISMALSRATDELVYSMRR